MLQIQLAKTGVAAGSGLNPHPQDVVRLVRERADGIEVEGNLGSCHV